MIGEGVAEEEEEAEETEIEKAHSSSLWEYEPEAEELLGQLIPEYVNISVYRALLESAASELGARMTAMRSAAENAEDNDGGPDPGDEPGPGRRRSPRRSSRSSPAPRRWDKSFESERKGTNV